MMSQHIFSRVYQMRTCPSAHLGVLVGSCAAGTHTWVTGYNYDSDTASFLPIAFRYVSGWTEYSSGITTPTDVWPRSIGAADSTHVWAVSASGSNIDLRSQIYFWGGSSWTLVDDVTVVSGTGYAYSWFDVAVVSDSDVWVLGYYQAYNLPFHVRHWNGSVWEWVTIPDASASMMNYMSGIAATASDVWAVGNAAYYFGVEPRSWHQLAVPWVGGGSAYVGDYGEFFHAWMMDSTHVFCCGYIQTGTATFSPQTVPDVKWYNGTTWSTLGTLPSIPVAYPSSAALSGIHGVSDSDLWVCGGSNTADYAASVALLYHWDGSDWTDYSPTAYLGPDRYVYLQSVVAHATNDVWAVGVVTCDDEKSHVYTLHWNGTTWTERPIPA